MSSLAEGSSSHWHTNLLRLREQALEIELRLLAPCKCDPRVNVVEPRSTERNTRQFLGKFHLGREIVYLLLLGIEFLLVSFLFFQIFQNLRVAVRHSDGESKLVQQSWMQTCLLHLLQLLLLLLLLVAKVFGRGLAVITQNRDLKIAVIEK